MRTKGFNKRAPRVDLRRPAILIDSDGAEHAANILDISGGGFRIEISEMPRIGEFVTLRVERGVSYPAQIRWVLGEEAGGMFVAPVGEGDWMPLK